MRPSWEERVRKRALKMSKSRRQGAASSGGRSSKRSKSSLTVTFSTGGAFSPFWAGFLGLSLGGWMGSERLFFLESQSRD